MSTAPRVSAYVRIPDGCPMSCRLTVSGDIEVLIGTPRDGFEFVAKREALAALVHIGQRALAEPETDEPDVELPALAGRGVTG